MCPLDWEIAPGRWPRCGQTKARHCLRPLRFLADDASVSPHVSSSSAEKPPRTLVLCLAMPFGRSFLVRFWKASETGTSFPRGKSGSLPSYNTSSLFPTACERNISRISPAFHRSPHPPLPKVLVIRASRLLRTYRAENTGRFPSLRCWLGCLSTETPDAYAERAGAVIDRTHPLSLLRMLRM